MWDGFSGSIGDNDVSDSYHKGAKRLFNGTEMRSHRYGCQQAVIGSGIVFLFLAEVNL